MCHYQEKCDNCGRFLSVGAPGVSWSQSWGYDWEGCPDQRDYLGDYLSPIILII